MHREEERTTLHPQGEYAVDRFRPEDAEGIVRLFRAVYGEGYPIRLFYDPQAIAAANAEGRYYSIVARAPSGEIIGATHLYRSAPYGSLYEWGAGLVSQAYRNRGVNRRLADFLQNRFVPGNPEIEELFGEPVCNHTHLQKAVISLQYVVTGIEVALMPAEAYTQEKSASGRVATLAAFRCCKPKRHRIFLPPAYEAVLRRIYGRLDDARDLAVADAGLPAGKATRAEVSVFDFARVARIAVPEAGADFPSRLAEIEGRARDRKAVVFQAWLNLTEPWVGEAVGILRRQGYFFGGALPRWFDGDGLLLQKLACPPDFERIALLSEESRELLAFLQEDHGRVTRNPGGLLSQPRGRSPAPRSQAKGASRSKSGAR